MKHVSGSFMNTAEGKPSKRLQGSSLRSDFHPPLRFNKSKTTTIKQAEEFQTHREETEVWTQHRWREVM